MTREHPPRAFIIAEAGVNHNGSHDLALQLVRAARDAGADAVKFQTFKADRLATNAADKADYQKVTSGADESQYAMLKRLELPWEQHAPLQAYCRECGVEFMSTPFDESCSDFLETLDMGRYKIPSGEITNFAFLRHVARKGRPIILSTGMSNLEEVGAALEAIRSERDVPVTVLHCVSHYPTDPAIVNLRAMVTMREAFGVPVGFSDHTMGSEVAIAAAALGAVMIEKHLTLDRKMDGPDHAASCEPDELAAMIRSIRNVELALGDGVKKPAAGEDKVALAIRKGLVAARDIAAGSVFQPADIAVLRPSNGLPPSARESVLGRTARVGIAAGTPITAELFA